MPSGPFGLDPVPLTPELVAYYRRMLRIHSADRAAGVCPVCRVAKCQDARFAWVQLVCASELYEPVVDPVGGTLLDLVCRAEDKANDRGPAASAATVPDDGKRLTQRSEGWRPLTNDSAA